MQDRDISTWHQFPIDIPTQKGCIYCLMQEPDENFLCGATSLWSGECSDWKECRSHAWGGRVTLGRLPGTNVDQIFKRFTIRNLRYIHKTYRARSTIRQEQAATTLGFHTAKIRCLVERRRWGIVVESALLFDAFEGAVPVYHLLNHPELGVNPIREKRRALLRALGAEVGRWHGEGLYHGDLHTGNILVRENDGTYSFHWIDNEEGRKYPKLPDQKRILDLDHINRLDYNLSLTDRYRFWDAYCRASRMSVQSAKEIAHKVLKRSQKYRRKRGMD